MKESIEKQLRQVTEADLSHYDSENNTYFIPKRKTIKIQEDSCYLVRLKESFYRNEVLRTNWNNNSIPVYSYLKIDVNKIMAKMIKVVAVAYDYKNKQDISYFWNGWLSLEDIDVLQKL